MANIYDFSDDEFIKLISDSDSRSDFFRKIGSSPRGGKFRTLNKRIKSLGLDISHFRSCGLISGDTTRISKEEVLKRLTPDSDVRGAWLKIMVIRYDLVEYKCQICQNEGTYCEKKLVLQLDHIDGKPRNNNLENLRFLCPNCHSQTETFSGKNRGDINKKTCECGNKILKGSSRCVSCRPEIVTWPDVERLTELVNKYALETVGKMLGCSGNAVKKKCLREGVVYPDHRK